jgi:hypothetical protein
VQAILLNAAVSVDEDAAAADLTPLVDGVP